MRVQIVSFHCILKDRLGRFISSSYHQDVVTTSPHSKHPWAAFAKELEALREGERKKIFIPAEEAYGLYQPNLRLEVPRNRLKNGRSLQVGDEILGSHDGHTARRFRVVELTPTRAILDGNHALAGQDLVFDVEMTSNKLEGESDVEWETLEDSPHSLFH